MRVVVIARHYWPKPGAATVRLQALVEQLVLSGDEVVVITGTGRDRRADRLTGSFGESVVRVPADTSTAVSLSRVFGLVRFAARACWIARRLHPDIVVADPPPTSGLAALGAGGRTVYYLADAWSAMLAEKQGITALALARIVGPAERWMMRRVQLVVSVRENLASFARKAGAKNVKVAPYGTDLTVFRPDGEPWDDDPWTGRLPYFLYAGNYGAVQGATVFLEAAEQLWDAGHQFGVVFMGYGSDHPYVQTLANRRPDVFVSLPLQPPKIAAAAHRGAVSALVSTRPVPVAAETRPAKALAATACGCPVIFAGAGAYKEEVDSAGIGRTADWDARSVAITMIQALRGSPDENRALRIRAAAHARTYYDIRPVAAKVVSAIRESAASEAARVPAS